MFLDILLAISFIGLLFCLFMIRRNNKVYLYRSAMSDIIFGFGVGDYKWRLKVYDSVSYQDMMRKWWKKLPDFYPDKSFLDPKKEDPNAKDR
jgi:hypothetical protein